MEGIYNNLEIHERREFLGTVASIAHKNDEFFTKLNELVQEYVPIINDKIGYGQVSNYGK